MFLEDVTIEALYNFEQVKRKGKTYMNFKDYTFNVSLKGVTFNFENLFNGDKRLGDNINKVLNENSLEVFEDVKHSYERAFGLVLKQLLNNLFSKVSIEEAFD